MKGKMPDGLLLKNGNGGMEYVMAGETVIGIKARGFYRAYLYRCYQKKQEEKSSKEQED